MLAVWMQHSYGVFFLFFHFAPQVSNTDDRGGGAASPAQHPDNKDQAPAAHCTPLTRQLNAGYGLRWVPMWRKKNPTAKVTLFFWNKKDWRVYLLGFNGAVPGKQQTPKCFLYPIIQEQNHNSCFHFSHFWPWETYANIYYCMTDLWFLHHLH